MSFCLFYFVCIVCLHLAKYRYVCIIMMMTMIVTFCDSTLNTANLCPAVSVVGLFYLLTVIMNFVCWFILGVDFTRRFRFCMCA